MTDKLGLIVELLLDDAAKAKALKGMKDMEKGIESVGATAEKVSKEQADAEKKGLVAQKNLFDGRIYYITKEEDARNKAQFKIEQENKKIADQKAKEKMDDERRAYAKVKFDAESIRVAEENARILAEANKVVVQSAEEIAAAEEEKAKRIKAAEKVITDAYEKRMKAVAKLNRLSEITGRTGQALSIGGMAIVGGAFAMAQAEANRQKSSGGAVDATTTKWLEANKRIELSTRRIAQTAERIILPYLVKASALAERASKYIEQNPEVVKAILAAGATAAVIGSALYLFSKGVRLVADIKSLAAEVNLAMALDRNTAALALSSKGGALGGLAGAGGASGALAGIGKAIGAGLVLALAAYLGAQGGLAIGNKIAGTKQTMGDVGQTALKIGVMGIAGLTSVLEKLGITSKGSTASVFNFLASITGVDGKAKKAADALDDLSESTEAAAESAKKNAEGWQIVRDLEQQNIEAEREFARQRADILRDSNQAIANVNQRYASTAGKIRSGLASTIGSLTADFNKANLDAEKQYQTERASIIQQGGEAIRQIQQDMQEQLRQLEEDYATQKADLMASRDAGGLVLAQREYEQNRERITEGASKEIAQRRRDMQQQLADLQQSHADQRAQRLAEYNQAILDAKAQAAKELAEAAEAKRLELAEIMRARQQQLAELARSYNEERRQRIQAAYNQIKDIGGALEVERAFKRKYYDIMLADVKTFMTSYAASLKSGLTGGAVKKMAMGGYSNGGLTMLHPGEFVMSPATTRAAEGLIGNRLTQSNVLRGGGASVQLVDNRRFDSRVPLAERNAIRQESIEDAAILISQMLKTGVA